MSYIKKCGKKTLVEFLLFFFLFVLHWNISYRLKQLMHFLNLIIYVKITLMNFIENEIKK